MLFECSSTNWKLAISFSGILCPSDFLMIEIIHDHRMPLRNSSVRHFIIHKGTIIFLSHFLSFYFNIIVMFKKSSLCNAQELFLCRPLFICAVCINYRLNLLHKGIIVVLVINSAEHWFAYNIAISVNKYSCWKGHDF